MSSTATHVSETNLAELHQRYHSAYKLAGVKPQTEYIDEWNAPCYDGEVRYGCIPWRSVRRSSVLDFSNIEHGLESQIHNSVKTFYGLYYAADLHVEVGAHAITLSQIMCDEDAERLQRNLIAHVLMKRQLQQEVTLFIGTSEDSDDLIVSVDNLSGKVGLEYAGKPHHKVLSESLADFLSMAQPRVIEPM